MNKYLVSWYKDNQLVQTNLMKSDSIEMAHQQLTYLLNMNSNTWDRFEIETLS